MSFPVAPNANLDALTQAEQDVLQLMMAGSSNRQIAHARGSSSRTVANQIASIFRKLGVASRAELAALLNTAGETGAEDDD